ncbi:hypothetical protein NF556_11590 [Ornithinimicrobium faecis]|uniref:Uncharacterized protein n=1 Tax=Ornithinimicrobium faecis TaxID=2934158 RepID=A0ABY4YNB7_9MICO|nr:hypothetical protein [Ornithinimicrobium sp. HY1793]USQ78296.1 hypothetical protein NF556_11590 [Ornithinimicrobium sp. HY1793]
MATSQTMPAAISEPTAWCRITGAAQARRAERLTGLDLDDPRAPVVLAPMVGTLTEHGTEADRTCDRCGHWSPPDEVYCPGLYWPRPRLALVLGLCARCADAEGVAP